jgi:acetolactate synthase-1/2/3 large subunit
MSRSNQPDKIADGSVAKKALDCADFLITFLERIGVECVFGVPGGAIEPLYNAMARSQRRGSLRPIVARHEAGAAFMADGYARESGRLGVCCTTTGPGATNIITGVASAYQDNIPLLLITAQTPLASFGNGAVQESSCTAINTVAMLKHCTYYSSLVSHASQLDRKLVSAIMTAYQASGPTHLSIPLDILRGPAPPMQDHNLESLLHHHSLMDPAVVGSLRDKLAAMRNMAIIVGEGCSDAVDTIMRFAESRGALLLATPQGKGLVDPYHRLFRGVCGLAGHSTGINILTDPALEVVLIVGSVLDEQATHGWLPTGGLKCRTIHIDRLPRNFSRSQFASLHVQGNISAVFEVLMDQGARRPREAVTHAWDKTDSPSNVGADVVAFERRATERRRNVPPQSGIVVEHRTRSDRRRVATRSAPLRRYFTLNDESKQVSDETPIKPQRLMYDLSRLFPSNVRYHADIGNSFLWAIHFLHPALHKRGDRGDNSFFRTSMGFASMGWAIGSSIGAALAAPDEPMVCIVGDGSMLMSGQELTVAVVHRLPVIFVVLNDQQLGTVRHGQHLTQAEPVGFELPPIDFAAVARAMGADAITIRSPEDFAGIDIAGICKNKGPTLLDIHIDPDEIPPLHDRIEMLACGSRA